MNPMSLKDQIVQKEQELNLLYVQDFFEKLQTLAKQKNNKQLEIEAIPIEGMETLSYIALIEDGSGYDINDEFTKHGIEEIGDVDLANIFKEPIIEFNVDTEFNSFVKKFTLAN